MSGVVCLNIVAHILFLLSVSQLLLHRNTLRLTPFEFIPFLLSGCIFSFITLSNIFEQSGITALFDPLEDIGELVFLFMCLFFINNWRSQRALEEVQKKEADLNSALQTILEQERRYRLLVENANDAILISQEEKIVFCNARTSELLGFSQEEILSRPFVDFIHPDDRDLVVSNYRKRIRLDQDLPSTYSFKLVTMSGATLTVQINTVLIEWNDKPATLSFVRDITEQLRMEQNLFHAQKIESIGTLAGGVAHDFNNILSAIVGYTELAKAKLEENPQIVPYLDKVLIASDRAKELIKQILTFSRHSSPDRVPVEAHLVVKEALKLLRSSIPATIEIRQQIDPESGLVLADATQLHQIVMNLCTNAYHAMRLSGGVLAVTLKKRVFGPDDIRPSMHLMSPGPYLELVVSDTGAGIDAEVLKKIFDPYFTTKKKGEGTGLGLSVVHGIVRNYGGHVSVYSEVEKGASFSVYLPAITDENHLSEKAGFPVCPIGHERAIVVDDEEMLAEMMEQMLMSLGYQVASFSDSSEALAHFRKNPDVFDFVITDMTMPNLDGVELITRIRALRAGLPIILCTGFSELIDGERATALGIHKFLMKPVSKYHLAEAVREVLDGR